MTEKAKEDSIFRNLIRIFLGLIIFGLIGSAASKAFSLDPGPIAPLVSVAMVLCGAAVIARAINDWISCVLVVAVCGISEFVGVLTGFPFGHYEYTDRWWPSIHIGDGQRYPLLVPFAWLLILGGSYVVVRGRFGKLIAIPMSAALTTLIDMPMEKAMTQVFQYWKWSESGPIFGVPISNSLGWFSVSLVGATILALRDRMNIIHGVWKIPYGFCVFVACCASLTGPDPAWIALFAIAAVFVWLMKPNPAP